MEKEWFSSIDRSILSTLLVSSSNPIGNKEEFLSGIRMLDLCDRELTTVPWYIKEMKNLKVLFLNENEITEADGGNFPETLEFLSLNNNKIEKFNFENFSPLALKNLKHLDLSFNKLKDIPEKAYLAQSLERLSLASNELKNPTNKLPKNLRRLDLDSNKMESVAGISKYLRTCYSVSLADNELTRIPLDIFTGILTFLDLDKNPLVDFGFSTVAAERLVTVNF